MEVAIGVNVEVSNGVTETNQMAFELNSNVNKEDEVSDNEVDAMPSNNDLEGLLFTNNEVGSSVNEEATSVSPRTNISTKNVGPSKAQKTTEKQNVNRKNPKARLSQSMSLPARGSIGSTLRKNCTSTKHSFSKTSKVDVKNSQTINPEGINGGAGDKLTTAARKSIPVKSGSVPHGPCSDTLKSNNDGISPLKQTVSREDDDDANSTVSSTTLMGVPRRKSTGSVFSFRLDERAERRKEFFTKLGEKINAMELEKTNLQEKSKESQEAELRRLRKSLTFKAAPMPSFYQEPGPLKIELKKKPPTRARSPKLGRNKSTNVVATSDSSDAGISSHRPKNTKSNPTVSNGKASTVHSKKSTQKSSAKLPSQKSTATNGPEAKSKQIIANQEPRTDEAEEKNNNPKNEEHQIESDDRVAGNTTIPDSTDVVVAAPSEATEVPV